MLKHILTTLFMLISMVGIHANPFHSKPKLSPSENIHSNSLPIEASPKIRIYFKYGTPAVLNICHQDLPCGRCPGFCMIIEKRNISNPTVLPDVVETIGEIVDNNHFKISFSGSDSDKVIMNQTVTFSQNNVLEGDLIQEIFSKHSITLLSGSYPIHVGENNTYFVIVDAHSN